jgi:hypothetical protein
VWLWKQVLDLFYQVTRIHFVGLNERMYYRLYPLTEDNNVPKALLPLANKPMLHYVLDWLERSGIMGI